MVKIKNLIVSILMLVIVMLFIGCGSNDDKNMSIVGTWEGTTTQGWIIEYVFKDNNEGIETLYINGNALDSYDFIWSQDGNTISVNYVEEGSTDFSFTFKGGDKFTRNDVTYNRKKATTDND